MVVDRDVISGRGDCWRVVGGIRVFFECFVSRTFSGQDFFPERLVGVGSCGGRTDRLVGVARCGNDRRGGDMVVWLFSRHRFDQL